MDSKQFYVYKLTSPVDKIYIGYTSLSPHQRYKLHLSNWKIWNKKDQHRKGSCTKLYYAFNKYSPKDWKLETLYVSDNINDALVKERELIVSLNSIEDGYNLVPGGIGGTGKKLTEEHKQHLSESRTKYYQTEGRTHLEELKQTGSFVINNPSSKKRGFGKKYEVVRAKKGTEEYSQLLSNAQKARWEKLTPEERSAQSNMLGKSQTEYQKQAVTGANSHRWVLRQPNGEVVDIVNLNKYSKERGLSSSNFTSYGKTKGYTVISQNGIPYIPTKAR